MFQNLNYKNLSLTFRSLFNRSVSLDSLSVQTADSFKLVALYGAVFYTLVYLRYASQFGGGFDFRPAFWNWVGVVILFTLFSSSTYIGARMNGGREDAPRVFWSLALVFCLVDALVSTVSRGLLARWSETGFNDNTVLFLGHLATPVLLFLLATPLLVRQVGLPLRTVRILLGCTCALLWLLEPLVSNLTLAVF